MNASSSVSSGLLSGGIHVLLGNILGMLTSIIFTGMYFPQFLLNRRRKSTEGFSSTGIIIKLVGASFLAVNAFVSGEAYPVVAYGALNILQHDLFMWQFFLYEKRSNMQYLMWMLFPAVPYYLWQWFPESIPVTSFFKPVSQVLSHIPQLLECRRFKTTAGVSLVSQHLNFVGGVMGLYMCWAIPPRGITPWFLYINSIGQAATLYAAWFYYDSGYFEPRPLLPLDSKDVLRKL